MKELLRQKQISEKAHKKKVLQTAKLEQKRKEKELHKKEVAEQRALEKLERKANKPAKTKSPKVSSQENKKRPSSSSATHSKKVVKGKSDNLTGQQKSEAQVTFSFIQMARIFKRKRSRAQLKITPPL